uniref:Putative small cys-rich protein n=1 Tax=Hyaloperonospora parasitica TaxID=123356 RepID=A2T2J8_9STRA|nr:putative small cys-rich protein [Hyaloperonospora parasitica]
MKVKTTTLVFVAATIFTAVQANSGSCSGHHSCKSNPTYTDKATKSLNTKYTSPPSFEDWDHVCLSCCYFSKC